MLALTAVCAILARCDAFGRGETLADLAKKQEQTAAESPETSGSAVSDGDLSAGENSIQPDAPVLPETEPAPALPEDAPSDSAAGQQETPYGTTEESLPDSSENEGALTENTSVRPEEDIIMEDRVTYQENFYYESLSDTVKTRITGISYPADDSNAAISYDTLRYVRVLYHDFNGDVQSGELICHKAIAQDLVEIFYELYEADYPIERICLVDEYQGDDELSMRDNNTSCFNYRALPSGRLSNHAYGLAIDLNPFYNPYVITRKDGTASIAPAGSEPYVDRTQDFAYKIDKEDLAYRLFTEHGFTWGGNWRSSKDYQHFEKAI